MAWRRLEFEQGAPGFVEVALWEAVANGGQLRTLLADGETALLDARRLVSLTAVWSAAWKAHADGRNGTLTTKNEHAELVFNLAPDSAITRALQTFGVGPETDTVLACLINATPERKAAVEKMVRGRIVPDANVRAVHSEALIRETYQIGEAEIAANTLENAVLTRIAAKVSKKNEML